MSAALLYRRQRPWSTYAALVCAAALHFAAVKISPGRTAPVLLSPEEPVEVGLEETKDPGPPPPLDPVTLPDPPVVPPVDDFQEETPNASRLTTKQARPVARPTVATSGARSLSFGAARSLTLNAPRPEYPYEARTRRITGSGMAVLSINQGSGEVTDARMWQSTGNALLDDATLRALRRWRFQPGKIVAVRVPITFTLNGAVY
jgi:protein TonB